MKIIRIALIAFLVLGLASCQSFQKERDLELYIVGGALVYAAAKHICRHSDSAEKCGVGSAAAFVLWY